MGSSSDELETISMLPENAKNTSRTGLARQQRTQTPSTSARSSLSPPPRSKTRVLRTSVITLLLLGAGISGAAAGVFASIRSWTGGGAGKDTSLEWVEQEARGCLKGKVVVVTGANQGIGLEIAKVMAGPLGADVVMACRNATACTLAQRTITDEHPGASVRCKALDLGRLRSVDEFAQSMKGMEVHTMVHNAGVMAVQDRPTPDGFEPTFQVNHLAPFLLSLSLLPNMQAAARTHRRSAEAERRAQRAEEGHSKWGAEPRVVWVSSGLHVFGSVRLASAEEEESHCGGVRALAFRQCGLLPRWQAYANSKLLNAMTAAEAHSKWHPLGVSSVSARPGTVATSIGAHSPLHSLLFRTIKTLRLPLFRSPRRAARGVALAAVDPSVEGGGYYDEGKPGRLHATVADREVNRQAWDTSVQLIEEWRLRAEGSEAGEEGAQPERGGEQSKATGNLNLKRAPAGTGVPVGGWDFDLPASLEGWRDCEFVPAQSSSVKIPRARDPAAGSCSGVAAEEGEGGQVEQGRVWLNPPS